MRRREADGGDLTVVTFNANQRLDTLRGNLTRLAEDTGQPHVMALQEVENFGGTVPGYQRVVAEPTPDNREADSCVLLVRRDLRVVRERHLLVKGGAWRWHREHPPRVYAAATIEASGRRWEVMGVHRIPGGPLAGIKENRQPWAAEHSAIEARVFKRADRAGHPQVLAGDWNDRADNAHPLSVASLAERLGGQLVLPKGGIDGAIVIGCRVVHAEKLDDKYGSDAHRPVVITLSAHRK
jgi:hypothetical protein